MQNWRFEVTDLAYIPQGEVLNAKSRHLTISLNKLDQLSFDISLNNPLADRLASTEAFIKGWRNGALVFYGPVITAEEDGDANGAHIAVTCQGGGWLALNKRFANAPIRAYPTDTATPIVPNSGLRTALDRAVIVKNEIATSNTDYGETGVSTTLMPISAAETVTYTIDHFTPMADLLRTMQSSDNGFDWRMVPVDNWNDVTGTVTSQKHTAFWAAPVLGQEQPEAIWEYGVGTMANLQSYKNMVSRETQMNWAIARPTEMTAPAFWDAGTQGTQKWGAMVEMTSGSELPTEEQWFPLQYENIITRRSPRRITTWQPHMDPSGVRMPDYGIDYEVGDIVHGRGIANGQVRFDGLFRCWGVDFEIMDNGFEKANLVVVEE